MKPASIRRITALHYISQGMSRRAAMLRAGYKTSTANQSTRVMRTASMQQLTDSTHNKMINLGITTDFIAKKIRSWLDAQKYVQGHTEPDFVTQIRAFDIYFNILKEAEKGS